MDCERCGSANTEATKTIMHNGEICVTVWCWDCRQSATRKPWVSKGDFTDRELADMRVRVDNRDPRHTCCVQGCGDFETEWNHFAPRHLWGEGESARWPAGWLCREHHREWHRRTRTGQYRPRQVTNG